MNELNGKKKRKLFHFPSKRKKKDKKRSQTDPQEYNEPLSEDDMDANNIPTKPHIVHDNTQSNPQHTDDVKMPNVHIENTAIDDLVHRMKSILTQLAALTHTSHHYMDIERFQKLIEWINYDESHLALLKQAWNDASFWPFLSTNEAKVQVKKDNQTMLIRLSNTQPGAITVTRLATAMKEKRLEEHVRHKRFFPAQQFGKLTLIGSGGERPVTWDGLLSYLKQKECCICLGELTDEQNTVLRLGCGHHFHRHCIEQHVYYSKKANGTDFAVCPLCRKPIQNAELIKEPSLVVYKHIPDIAKSKSFDDINRGNKHLSQFSQTDEMQRAFSAEPPNHPWSAFGNHLGVHNGNPSMDDDDYGNMAQVRQLADKNKGTK